MNISGVSPLSGMRVIDFTTLLPGPLATLLLHRAGAEVIKVESPAGDPMRNLLQDEGAVFSLLNQGKRSLSLDLKDPEMLGQVKCLCKGADIVVEQFRPGVMARLGLDAQTLRRENPGLIYCSITGYGQTGDLSQTAGHDINYIAESGLFSILSDSDGGPLQPPVLLADIVGGAYPAFSNILLALISRGRTGQGVHLDISMTRGLQALAFWAVPAAAQGVEPQPLSTLLHGGAARYRCYCCADSEWLAVGALEEKFWARFCELIDLPQAMRLLDPLSSRLISEVAARIATRSSHEWISRFEGEDVCCSRVRKLSDVVGALHDPGQDVASGCVRLPLPLAPLMERLDANGVSPVLGDANSELLQSF